MVFSKRNRKHVLCVSIDSGGSRGGARGARPPPPLAQRLDPPLYRIIETLVKVCEDSKKLWKHSPVACVPTAFLVLPNIHLCFYLTNRFHVAVRLFSNRSQMTSKCGKNKKVAHEAIAECVTDVLTTF